MTENEVFNSYCEKYGIDLVYIPGVEYWVTSTFSYKRFELHIATEELKQSIKNSISDIKKRLFK